MIRKGTAPYLECSSRGDRRFSAFYARLNGRANRSIEEIYQAAKVFSNRDTGLSWKQAKGRCPVNLTEVKTLYALLWDEYIAENPDLLRILKTRTGLSDMFGQEGHQCQVIELWRIRNEND